MGVSVVTYLEKGVHVDYVAEEAIGILEVDYTPPKAKKVDVDDWGEVVEDTVQEGGSDFV